MLAGVPLAGAFAAGPAFDQASPLTTVAQLLPRASVPSSASPGSANSASPEGLSPRPGDNTSGDQTLQLTPAPTSPPPRIGLFPAFGDRLLRNGIDFHGLAFDHFLANPTAGVQPGQTANLFAFRPAVDVISRNWRACPAATSISA
jgi:hypothetical protein